MPVDARRFIRKMRGGAQAHLLEASDGHFYVVKFRNNPQHGRILVNEWIASVFLEYLGISAPKAAMVRVAESFLEHNPEVYFQLGSGAGGGRAGMALRLAVSGRSDAHGGVRFSAGDAA